MKEWNEHRNECASIYDSKWSEMEAMKNIFDEIVGGMTIDQLKIEKEKWERGGFIGGKDELLNRWIGDQSRYHKEMLEDAMENHREWAEDEAEQTFKYTVIVNELKRRISEKTHSIGQQVRFGAYGETPDADKLFTITDIKDGTFTLQDESGNTFTAYADEVF